MAPLDLLSADFEARVNRSLSLPLAGTLVWIVVGVLGLCLPERAATLALVFATGAIFPLAMAISKLRGEQILGNPNPLAKLMGVCVFMVNLLWALHVPLLLQAPQFVPLSLGLGLGLHWAVYAWITGHPAGHVHVVLRTLGLSAAWWLVPDHRVTACAAAVVLAYAVAIAMMATRPLPARAAA